jgi:YHS domain-containing protein
MKKLMFILNISTALFFVSCNRNSAEHTATTTPVPDTKSVNVKLSELGSTKDFVCGMPLEEGGVSDTASFENKLYGFCSSECKAEFLKSPQTYLAQQ